MMHVVNASHMHLIATEQTTTEPVQWIWNCTNCHCKLQP